MTDRIGPEPRRKTNQAEDEEKLPFVEPKLEYLEPELVKHGKVAEITEGFFGGFNPGSP